MCIAIRNCLLRCRSWRQFSHSFLYGRLLFTEGREVDERRSVITSVIVNGDSGEPWGFFDVQKRVRVENGETWLPVALTDTLRNARDLVAESYPNDEIRIAYVGVTYHQYGRVAESTTDEVRKGRVG